MRSSSGPMSTSSTRRAPLRCAASEIRHSYNLSLSLEPGEHNDVDFIANKPGVFPLYCTEFCSALHLEMAGYFMVAPKSATAAK